jgi:uncharacterized protein
MLVDVAGLSEGSSERLLTASANDLRLQTDTCIFDGSVTAAVAVHKAHDEVVVEGRVRTSGRATCVRCLEEFTVAIDEPFRLVARVVPDSEVKGDTGDDDFAFVPQSAPVWDLSAAMRDFIVLAVPDNPLCRPDCAGLCPGCGRNLNTESCVCLPPPPSGPLAGLRTLIDAAGAKKGSDGSHG